MNSLDVDLLDDDIFEYSGVLALRHYWEDPDEVMFIIFLNVILRIQSLDLNSTLMENCLRQKLNFSKL